MMSKHRKFRRPSKKHNKFLDPLFQGKVVQALSSIMSKSWFWPKTSKKPKGAAAVRARGRSSLAKKKGKIAAKAAAQRGKAGITLTKKADVSNFKLVDIRPDIMSTSCSPIASGRSPPSSGSKSPGSCVSARFSSSSL